MTRRRSDNARDRLRALGVLLLLMGIAGCEDGDRAPVTRAKPGAVPPSEQRPGDPEAGYDILVNGGYVSCGIPYTAWRRTNPQTTPLRSLPGRSSRNSRLPYFLTLYTNDDGVELVTTNCLLCHAGMIDGELVIGLGNESLDFTDDPRAGVDAAGSYVSGEAGIEAWRKWSRRIDAMAPYMVTDTVGVNPAPNLTLALIAHRDPQTLEWSDEPLIEPPRKQPLPVSVPPWWRMSKKHAMFYNGMGRGDHTRYMMMKSLVCADGIGEVEQLHRLFADVRAFIASLEPPPYPYAVDPARADEGEAIFSRRCASCHGTYGENPDYPNLIVDLDTVGTDPEYARQALESERFMEWFNRSWYGQGATARPAPGYIAPPLDGVWATAPFLHNGSVPTIAALLDSGRRPTYWSRDSGSRGFDDVNLGWKYEALDGGKDAAADAQQRERIYDTTLPGYSNAGHTFGDALTASERAAVIEYLKTL